MNRSTRKTVARFAPLTSQARTRAGHPASRLAAPGKARIRSRQQGTVGLPDPHGRRPYESQSCTPVTRSKFGKANCHRQALNALERRRGDALFAGCVTPRFADPSRPGCSTEHIPRDIAPRLAFHKIRTCTRVSQYQLVLVPFPCDVETTRIQDSIFILPLKT